MRVHFITQQHDFQLIKIFAEVLYPVSDYYRIAWVFSIHKRYLHVFYYVMILIR
jgi:hypothetical protein